ncbi:glycoside hydrolase, family 16 [Sporothrix brasiliensis 5110]|uniref:Glycoside hydrolase, family 16 n=1 Tax=Sporothrix brasiliensis 5110 TaxID=1398154 RepID=A0A0C2IZ36_9PEZI|nr:glycoside hydrolase, family 16 [Sporothrix brasiliensis 5110]KIH90217.1 glycoside hydrolase, family 16 [Sporothrix brasiliensis 5110]
MALRRRFAFPSFSGSAWSISAVVGAILLFGFARPAAADCECGYSTVIDGDVQAFTDLIETDFAHLDNISTNTDWVRQAFNVTSEKDRGSYGEMYAIENMRTQPDPNGQVEDGQAKNGQPAGLDLTVKANIVAGMVPVSEIDTNRTDILYGSFRAGMKLTNVSGTCSAFFWYFNDTQEIDMEFLSKEYNASNNTYPVNLVLQSREAAEDGFDAQGTPTFLKVNLPFDPTADFHEYRIDFLPGSVYFYADSELLAEMDSDAVPTHAGHLVLQQWSNGNPLWSAGPPTEDAVTTVSYVKAYFNSSLPQRQQDWNLRCRDPSAPGAVCTIPDSTATNTTPAGWFFTSQNNMTNNQTVSGQKNSGRMTTAATVLWPVFAIVFAIVGWELNIW